MRGQGLLSSFKLAPSGWIKVLRQGIPERRPDWKGNNQLSIINVEFQVPLR